MEIRGKRCLTCGTVTGLMNDSCDECDSTSLIEFREKVDVGDRAFWGLTVAKSVESSRQAYEFEEAVLGSSPRWNSYYDGHGVEATAVPGVGTEVTLVELHWYFNEDDGHAAVDLQRVLYGLRPGLMGAASISVTFFDTIEIVGED